MSKFGSSFGKHKAVTPHNPNRQNDSAEWSDLYGESKNKKMPKAIQDAMLSKFTEAAGQYAENKAQHILNREIISYSRVERIEQMEADHDVQARKEELERDLAIHRALIRQDLERAAAQLYKFDGSDQDAEILDTFGQVIERHEGRRRSL